MVLVEIFLVIIVAYLPQKHNMIANTLISFICALQVETFRKVHGSAFATTMCTGNLRSATFGYNLLFSAFNCIYYDVLGK